MNFVRQCYNFKILNARFLFLMYRYILSSMFQVPKPTLVGKHIRYYRNL